MKTLRLLGLAFLGMALFVSCEKEPVVNPDPKTMEELIVHETFDWKTTVDYQFNIQGTISRVIMITAADGSVYKKGLLSADKPYSVKLALPAYVKSVRLKYNGQVAEVPLTSVNVNYSFR